MIGPIFSFSFFLSLAVVWTISAFFLTLGVFIVGKISGWSGDEGFWSPFPAALLVSFILTIVDWGLGFLPIPFFSFIIKVAVWCLLIMKVLDLKFPEAISLTVIIFILKLLLATFILSCIFSLIPG